MILEAGMGIKNDESTDRKISRKICQAFEQVIETMENEPGLILEGENQPTDGEKTFKEIRTWLFSRRRADGHTDSRTDK
jgi:hypothetical protein